MWWKLLRSQILKNGQAIRCVKFTVEKLDRDRIYTPQHLIEKTRAKNSISNFKKPTTLYRKADYGVLWRHCKFLTILSMKQENSIMETKFQLKLATNSPTALKHQKDFCKDARNPLILFKIYLEDTLKPCTRKIEDMGV